MRIPKIFFIIILSISIIIFLGYTHFKNIFYLNVIQVIDERFEYLDDKQMERVLQKVSKTMKQKFNTEVYYKYKSKISCGSFFKKYSYNNNINEYRFNIFDLENEENMVPSIYYSYKKKYKIDELKEFINKYEPEPKDYKKIIKSLLAIHYQKISLIKDIRLNDKTALLKRDKFDKNSLARWTIKNCKSDVVITNSLIIDDQYDIPPHSLIRGGVLFGFSQKSKARYGASAVVSIFPIITRLEYFVKERGYYKSEEELDMIAYMVVKELLHSLYKYEDDYKIKNSPLNPIRDLRIKEWHKYLKTIEKFEVPTKKSSQFAG